MKKAIVLLLLCLVVFWLGRIISINQNPPIITYYSIGDTVDYGDLELFFAESHFDELSEFNNRFGCNYENEYKGECKMISICIEVTNKTEQNINWNDIILYIGLGFKSKVWGSAPNAELLPVINKFDNEGLGSGKMQKIWLAAVISDLCFKHKTWEHLTDYQYYYMLPSSPQKIAVRLKL